MTRNRALGALIALLFLSAGYADLRVFLIGNRQSNDERQTCVIQSRGLPASRHLAAAMQDISKLLSLQTPAQLAKEPPFVRDLLTDLRGNSRMYGAIEAQQPKTRSC